MCDDFCIHVRTCLLILIYAINIQECDKNNHLFTGVWSIGLHVYWELVNPLGCNEGKSITLCQDSTVRKLFLDTKNGDSLKLQKF